ncbi:Uncharacterised protein [Mycobacterium tuberculosis]|nr:Uncharacterised protein [Mycobacterium tuberculosis]
MSFFRMLSALMPIRLTVIVFRSCASVGILPAALRDRAMTSSVPFLYSSHTCVHSAYSARSSGDVIIFS